MPVIMDPPVSAYAPSHEIKNWVAKLLVYQREATSDQDRRDYARAPAQGREQLEAARVREEKMRRR